MPLLEKHDQEIYFLQRRLLWITEIDRYVSKDPTAYTPEELVSEFRNVENPSDFVTRLKEIYGNDLP